jgi:hypothetical protein
LVCVKFALEIFHVEVAVASDEHGFAIEGWRVDSERLDGTSKEGMNAVLIGRVGVEPASPYAYQLAK